MLFIDPKSCSIWSKQVISSMVSLPKETVIQEYTITRLKDSKSMVDVALCTGVCQKIYNDKYNRAIIVSSDSDYLAMIDLMKSFKDFARFAVSYETDSVSWKYLSELDKRNVTLVPIAKYRDNESLNDKIELSIKCILADILKKTPIDCFNRDKFCTSLLKLFEKTYISIYTADSLKQYINKILNKVNISFIGDNFQVQVSIDDMIV